MTDRELLEMAAKAAGIRHIEYNNGYDGRDGLMLCTEHGHHTMLWSPLTDDGDALKLAVKLGMVIGTYANYSTVDLLSPNSRIETVTVWHSSTSGNDPYAATRRAIVRAAAEIGKEMP